MDFPSVTYEENPLATLEQDYSQAVIHLAWDFNNITRQRTLLFAAVELLPAEMPLPHDEGERRIKLKGSRNFGVYVRNVITSAKEAITWYRSCIHGISAMPDATGQTDRFNNLEWDEEPRWPNLTCVLDATVTPFLSRWHQCPRVHHLIATNFKLESHWQDSRDREEAAEWLEIQLGFDLRKYESLWGSIHLIAPNPVFRNFRYDRGKEIREGFETVAYKVDFRSGKRPSELTLVVRDDTVTGAGLIKAIAIDQEIGSFLTNREFSTQSIYVIDKLRGPLYGLESFMFIGGVSTTMNLVTAQRDVQDEHGNTVRTVPLVGSEGLESHANLPGQGNSRPQLAAARLRSEKDLQHRRWTARENHEKWFQGDKDTAVNLVRDLLQVARHRVLIVDPYFRRSELQFALVVSNTKVPIRILTSAEVLNKVSIDDCSAFIKKARCMLNCNGVKREKIFSIAQRAMGLAEKFRLGISTQLRDTGNQLLGNTTVIDGEQLLEAVQIANASPQANPLEIKVMTGGSSDVHDRFLMVDEKLWLLGSSLNDFGSRGTMIVPITYPTHIESRLEENWKQATTLEDWLKKRHVDRQALKI